ncbi:MAG TPA: hypothetical protein VGO78_19420 [Acidimicrobiales bacterium]|nr:hypothetical protein [Acidimicrobiales bacterium]
MSVDPVDTRRLEGDLRIALLTGAVGWRDRNSHYLPVELAVVAVLVTSIIAVLAMLLVSAGLPAESAALAGNARWFAAVGAGVTLTIGIAPTLAWPFGLRPRRMGPIRELAVLRVTAAMVVVGCWTALLGPIAPVPAWPLGSVVGCECMLTAWSLGVEMSGPAWWWRFQTSSVNAGVVLVCVVAIAIGPERLGEVLAVFLTFQVITLAAAVTCAGLTLMRGIFDRRDARLRRAALAEGHKRLAYWIHNAVTTPLRDLRLRLQAGDLDPGAIVAALERSEHELRLRQLDEVLATGRIELAELLQPHVRRAQDSGVVVTEVPRFAEAGIEVEGDVGRLVYRALDVLVPNAIAAGAGRLAFRITTDPGVVTVEVEDDAGGFDLASVPAGRALHGLQNDLGRDRVTCTRTPQGSRVRVMVAVDGGQGGNGGNGTDGRS